VKDRDIGLGGDRLLRCDSKGAIGRIDLQLRLADLLRDRCNGKRKCDQSYQYLCDIHAELLNGSDAARAGLLNEAELRFL
jgi:hypothetical protein